MSRATSEYTPQFYIELTRTSLLNKLKTLLKQYASQEKAFSELHKLISHQMNSDQEKELDPIMQQLRGLSPDSEAYTELLLKYLGNDEAQKMLNEYQQLEVLNPDGQPKAGDLTNAKDTNTIEKPITKKI